VISLRLIARTTLLFVVIAASPRSWACELCAVYNASSARGESSSGFLVSVSEQFTAYRTTQFEGEEIDGFDRHYLDSSITHLVPSYNFSPRFGVSLNIPLVYNSFWRMEDRRVVDPRGVTVISETEHGSEFNLGDVALIGRATVFARSEMEYGVLVNFLGGVKFPTGDSSRVADEVEQARIYESLLGGIPHPDPLSHSRQTGVHRHMLAAGSGSYDGIFGVTVNTRWKRWFLNSQFQYYLRQPGEDGFEFGDEIIVAGGPGTYIALQDAWTLSLQLNAIYETEGRVRLLDRKSDSTGMTAWYLGPQISFTYTESFSAVAGVDVPLHITSNGLQNVPTYRVHAGLNYRF
jgi:hypothetical protein